VVFTGSDHPLAFAMKCDGCDVAGVSFEGDDGVRVTAVDVIESDVLITGRCKVLFVR